MDENRKHFIVESDIKGAGQREKYSQAIRVFRSALDRMNEYPEFTFTCSSAVYYELAEKADREMFAEITERIREGRWTLSGGWWAKPESGVLSGEMYARQFLYGQLYYYKKFGKICRTGICGSEAVLPQFLYKSGMHGAVCHMPAGSGQKMPFWWDSADGTRVVGYPYENGAEGDMLITDIRDSRIDSVGKSLSDVQFSSPDAYFYDLLSQNIRLERRTGVSADAASENDDTLELLESAEKWNLIASKNTAAEPATESMADAWKALCQADSEENVRTAEAIASDIEITAQISIADSIDTLAGAEQYDRCVVIFNAKAHEAEESVCISGLSGNVWDCGGNQTRFYNTPEETVFFAKVPALGYAVYYLAKADGGAVSTEEKKPEKTALRAVETGFHKGAGAPGQWSFLTVDADNVKVEALKYCEDGSGDAILRCYETAGNEITHVMLLCELLDCGFWFDIGKDEAKTFRIAKDGHVTEVNFLEGITK